MENKKRVSYNKYDAGKTFLLALFSPYLVIILLMCIFGAIILLTGNSELKDGNVFNILSSLASQLGFIILFILYNKFAKIDTKKAITIQSKIKFKQILIVIAISILSIYGLNYFLSIFDELFKFIGYTQPTSLALPLDNFGWYIVNVIVLAIIPAVCEEILFRGMILSGLKDYGVKKAVLLSAVLFSLMHTSPLQTIYPFLLGIVLAIVMIYSDNILLPIILHFVNNFIVITRNYIFNMTGFVLLPTLPFYLVVILGIVTLILTAFIVFLLLKLLKKQNENKNIEMQNNVLLDSTSIINSKKNVYLWTGIGISIFLWMVVFISYI